MAVHRLRRAVACVLALCVVVLVTARPQGQAQGPASSSPLPPTAEAHVASGLRYASAREFDKAIEAFQEALRLNPAMAKAHLGLGSAYHNMGRLADAVDPLTTAVRLDPQNAGAHLNLGVTLAMLRRQDEALAELMEAKRLSPGDARIRNAVGNALNNGFSQLEAALAEYREAARLEPGVAAFHLDVGIMLVRLGRPAESIDPFAEAVRLDASHREARYHLSNAYTQLGRYDDAIGSWTRFLQLVPDDPEALHNRAWVYMYAGRQGAAAAADARRFLQVAGWRHRSSAFMAIVAHLGGRQAGVDDRAVLDEAATRLPFGAWPYPVVAYLRRDITAERVMEGAASNDQKTEAHAYVGMDLLLGGRVDDARQHFEWVRDYGNRRYIEYTLAVAELGRL